MQKFSFDSISSSYKSIAESGVRGATLFKRGWNQCVHSTYKVASQSFPKYWKKMLETGSRSAIIFKAKWNHVVHSSNQLFSRTIPSYLQNVKKIGGSIKQVGTSVKLQISKSRSRSASFLKPKWNHFVHSSTQLLRTIPNYWQKARRNSLKLATSSASIVLSEPTRIGTDFFKTKWNSIYQFFQAIPNYGQSMMQKIPSVRQIVQESAELIWIRISFQWQSFIEWMKVAIRYYPNPTFFKIDMALLCSYLFRNPYRMSKKFLMRKGESDIHVYGETPLTSLDLIAEECRISSQDIVFELGCGRGRACFWLSCFKKCRVVGIEHIPDFVKRAQRIKEKLDVKNVEFRLENMFEGNFSEATVIYLYGTCLDTSSILKLIRRMSKLPSGTKIITVSYPLSDYTSEPLFEVMKRFPVRFSWGMADVYLQYKK